MRGPHVAHIGIVCHVVMHCACLAGHACPRREAPAARIVACPLTWLADALPGQASMLADLHCKGYGLEGTAVAPHICRPEGGGERQCSGIRTCRFGGGLQCSRAAAAGQRAPAMLWKIAPAGQGAPAMLWKHLEETPVTPLCLQVRDELHCPGGLWGRHQGEDLHGVHRVSGA